MLTLQAFDMQLSWSSDIGFPGNLGISGTTPFPPILYPCQASLVGQLSHLSLERQGRGQWHLLKPFLYFLKANPSLEMLRLKDAGPLLSKGNHSPHPV